VALFFVMENPFPTEPPPSDPSDPSAHPAQPEAAPEATHASATASPEEVEQPQDSATTISPEHHAATSESGHPQEDGQATEHPTESAETEPVPGTLEDYALRARKGRLNPEEEAEAGRLLKEALLGGRAEVAKAVIVTPQLPWVVTVQATASVWPEIKPTFRAQFLAGLARTPGEAAARIRLSLARGLFKVDPAASLKLILLTLKVLRDKETGLLEGKGASILANVLIGRGKAWVLQLPLTDLKPPEVDLLVFASLHGAFHQPQAPLTQLSILKWAAAADRLSKLPEALEQMLLKGVSRWSGKWQASLRREVAPLPDAWVNLLKSPAPSGRGRGDAPTRSALPSGQDDPDSPDVDSREERASLDSRDSAHPENDADDRDREDEEEDEDEEDANGGDAEESSDSNNRRQKQRPVYVSKTVPGPGNHHGQQQQSRRGGAQPFNLQDTLRQVEQHVAGLRNELQAAHKQLRQREDDGRRNRRNDRPAPVANPADLSLEEAIRLNHQLESRNAELQSRIDELTLDSEARATSQGLVTDTPVEDANTVLRTLLGFKLKEDFEDFQALEQEARDLVVQQHYRTVLRHVFEVLDGEGVRFEPEKPR
jgi:hypothetical protein